MKRPIRIEGDVAYVPLTKGYEAVIDAADVPLVEGFNWCACEQYRPDGSLRAVYAVRSIAGLPKRMHRVLMDAAPNIEVDHVDSDGLNNRRGNLRCATDSQNMFNARTRRDNASGVKGVSWAKREQRWRAYLNLGGKQRCVGYFPTVEAAKMAVETARRNMHGDFARHA